MTLRTWLAHALTPRLLVFGACAGDATPQIARPAPRAADSHRDRPAVATPTPPPSNLAAANTPPVPDDVDAEPPPTCEDLDEAAMWASIPAAERAGLDALRRNTAEVELDGAVPTEVALAVNVIRDYGDGGSKSLLWVLRCRVGVWSVIGTRTFEISEAWDGFYDGQPGIQVMRSETIAGAPHAFLRVEVLDQQGGMDPRFSRREFSLLHLTSAGLVTAFDCVTRDEVVEGPMRETASERLRVVTYQPHATIRVRVSGADGGGPNHRIASADYVFDGNEFHATRDVCAE